MLPREAVGVIVGSLYGRMVSDITTETGHHGEVDNGTEKWPS